MADTPLDPQLLQEPVVNQPRLDVVTVTLPTHPAEPDNASDPEGNDGNEGSEKRRKLNLWKCRQCRDARKKCYPVNRIWPEKCERCRRHRPDELECSEPQLNTRKRGPNVASRARRAKTTVAADKQEPRAKESDDETESDASSLYNRPVRTMPPKPIKIERPKVSESPETSNQPIYDKERPATAYLPLKDNEFRILYLDPGRREDPLVFSFVTATISQPLKYEAVSYLWGGNDGKQQDLVDTKLLDSNGKPHTIPLRSNLHAALRSLRHPKTPRLFWVDALCINHNDRKEKNKQIAIKRDIFHNAFNLCFWLGEDANSKAALTFIPRILDLAGIANLVQDDAAIDGWVAFVALLKNTVFSRLMLLQEVAIAKNVTLHCGVPAIHYRDLVEAVAMFVSFRGKLARLFHRNQKNYKELGDQKITIAERFIDVSTNSLRVSNDGKTIQRLLSIEELVTQLSDLSSTDPRDRIFSVLAMARDGPPLVREQREYGEKGLARHAGPLKIDYDKSVLDVYQDFVEDVIKRSKCLNIICRHWASSVPKEVALPTWIRSSERSPFISNMSERTEADSLVGFPDCSYYNASRGTAARFRVEPGESGVKSLFVKGFCIDTILEPGPRTSEGIILCEWLQLAGCTEATTEVVDEAFPRTLVADRGPNGTNVPPWYERALMDCLHHLTPTGDINTNDLIAASGVESSLVVDFLKRVQSVIWNRRFFISHQNRWMGLAPMNTQSGDIICILYGCSVPVVLRLRKRLGPSTPGYYELVGECYVDKMMNGEATEPLEAGLGLAYPEMEFELR